MKYLRQPIIMLVVIALMLGATPVFAQTGGPYDLTWSNLGPGAASSGGTYSIEGSAGQPDAGTASGGSYTLVGGFWAAAAGCTLLADIDQDGSVTVLDIQAVALEWRSVTPAFPYDQDNDGDVDIQDIMLVAAHLGETC